jgi:hypothetical protein
MRDAYTPPPFRSFGGHWSAALRAAEATDPSAFAIVLAAVTATLTFVGVANRRG